LGSSNFGKRMTGSFQKKKKSNGDSFIGNKKCHSYISKRLKER
jgi:hypothetical protein